VAASREPAERGGALGGSNFEGLGGSWEIESANCGRIIVMTRTWDDQFSNPLHEMESKLRAPYVDQVFGKWVDVNAYGRIGLSLYPFAYERPLEYIAWDTFESVLAMLESDITVTLESITRWSHSLSHAVQSVTRPGSSWSHEEDISTDKPKDVLKFEQIWHPEYQRYVEHSLNHLTRLPLELLGRLAGKDYQSQGSLAARLASLRADGREEFTRGYHPVVRNAIAHGSTFYLESAVRYVDAKGNTEDIIPWDFEKLFDHLVDVCHAYVAAILVFVCRNWEAATAHGLHRLPLGVRQLLVKAKTSTSIFEVDSMLEGDAAEGATFLNVHCNSRSKARFLQLHQGLSMATEVVRLGGSPYSRIAVSIDCGPAVSSLMMVDVPKLQNALAGGAQNWDEIIQGSLLWYDRSSTATRVFLIKTFLATSWRAYCLDMRKRWRAAGFGMWHSRYCIRSIEERTVESLRRLHVDIVLRPNEAVNRTVVQGVLLHAVRKLKRKLIPSRTLEGPGWRLGRPTYVWIRLFRNDCRVRQLKSSGFNDNNFVAMAEWTALRNRRKPIFVKQPDEFLHGVRFKYFRIGNDSARPGNHR
jgi:hypothetical protein